MTTILLHGFWGQPMDWNPVLARLPLAAEVWAPDLYDGGPLSPAHVLEKWTSSFINEVSARYREKVQLVGYSMGGRLAASAWAAAPQLFARGLLLSAAPVTPQFDPSEREAWERQWVAKFLSEPWEQLELEWQEQPVFSGSALCPRRRSVALRAMLGLSLLHWSPRQHGFGSAEVKAWPATLDYAFGALDQKYLGVAKMLQELPVKGQIGVIPNSGHRLIADAPGHVADWIVGGG